MFEAANTFRMPEPGAEGALRTLDWAEIVARLAAVRDLRAVLSRPALAGGGFVPQAAAGIAGVGEPAVNLAALAGGKWVDATTVATAGSAATGDRDK